MKILTDITDTFRPARRWLTATAAVTTLLVSLAGPAAAASAPEVFSGFKNSLPMVGTGNGIAGLQLPIGTYALTAKVSATNNNGSTNTVECKLSGGPFSGIPDFDISAATLTSSVRNQTLALQMVAIANKAAQIFLTCHNSNANADTTLKFIKITATRVFDPNHLHNEPLFP